MANDEAVPLADGGDCFGPTALLRNNWCLSGFWYQFHTKFSSFAFQVANGALPVLLFVVGLTGIEIE